MAPQRKPRSWMAFGIATLVIFAIGFGFYVKHRLKESYDKAYKEQFDAMMKAP